MKERFFEGAGFKREFKPLIPRYYPPKYRKYIQEETKLLKAKVRGAKRILEAGVGIGRLITPLAPLVKEFVGIDNADLMLQTSENIAKNYSNVRIVKGDLERLRTLFPQSYFDFSLCVWNTLGNVRNEVAVLTGLGKVTAKRIFITVYLKGTLRDREKWYSAVGIKIARIDRKNEIFYSKNGLKSKAYSVPDLCKIATKARLKIKALKTLNGVILWAEFARQ